jgi:signal transduction histidine kinase
MTSSDQNIHPEGKEFRLVKFFSWASFIVLLIFSFPLSMVISQQAKEILLESYENNALLVGEHLNSQVYQYFVVPTIQWYGAISLREERQYELMDEVVRHAIHGFRVDQVNIYDIEDAQISYSTNPDLIGRKGMESLGYRKALQGEHSSGIISSTQGFLGLDIGLAGAKKMLQTYVPSITVDPYTGERGSLLGVFELYQDMSEEYDSIVRFQIVVFGLSIMIMFLIFVALLLIVRKAEDMIRQRAKEQYELEAQLHLAERLAALGEMVAGVSHEIKNPLGIIRSTAELLGEMPEASDAQKRLSGVIKEESSRLNQIVTEFLDFARPQEPNLQECQLKDIIEKNLSFMQPELDRIGIKVRANIDGRPLKLMADQELLYQAFLNILINAIQSMENGGALDIKIEKERGLYRIEVQDTGCGISEELKNRVFEPFFTTKDKGSGLGLPIVKKIIEGHRGTVSIKSKEGEGTRVQIRLPRAG